MKILTRSLPVAAAALAVMCASAAQADIKRISIGSNRQGSVFFLLASGFAKHIQQNLKIRTTAQPHAGSSVYLPLVDKGEITMGLNNSMDTAAAVRGQAPFKRKLDNVRVLARVWIIPEGVLVRGDSGIKSLADLRGKRVVTDIKTIVSMGIITRHYLASGNVTVGDVVGLKSGGIVKSVNMVVEGRADAAVVGMGMPQVRKAHATLPGGIRFLSLGARGTDAYILSKPGMAPHKAKPAKRYPYVTEPLNMLSIDTYLNAGPTVSNELAYTVVKSLHQSWTKLQKAYGPLRGVKPNRIAPTNNSGLFHPGAVKYYKEAGIWSAAHEKQAAAIKKDTM